MKNTRQTSSAKEPIIKRDLTKKPHFQPKKNPFNKKRIDQIRSRISKPFYESEKEILKKDTGSVGTTKNELSASFKKNWWIHLWSGLVIDESAKHQKAMRQAIWLYLFLLLVANRRNGMLFRRISTIEKETGFNRRSIGRWLKVLRENDYIKTYSTGRFLQIAIQKWKPIINRQKKGP